MIRPALLSDALLRRLNTAILATGGVVALAAAGLGISLLLENTAASNARLDRTEALEREQAAKQVIAKAKTMRPRTVPARADQQLESFGSTLAEVCRAENVTFSTFDNSGEAGAYTTRYTGTTEGKEWKASEARVTIQGHLADIYTVLGKLKGHPVPFEVIAGSLDGGAGEQDVRASLTIVVLVREEKVASRG